MQFKVSVQEKAVSSSTCQAYSFTFSMWFKTKEKEENQVQYKEYKR